MLSRITKLLLCASIAGCASQEKPIDELPFKKNAIVIYSDQGGPIQNALVPLCRQDQRGDSANRSKQGIAIVGGWGFNYKYDDPRASEAVLYMSKKLSEALQEEIKRCAIPSTVLLNTDQQTDIRAHVSEALSKGQFDGLVQINIAPRKVKDNAALYISVGYLPIKWEARSQGAVANMGSGPSESYAVDPDKPLALYARKFATVLRDKGYIGY